MEKKTLVLRVFSVTEKRPTPPGKWMSQDEKDARKDPNRISVGRGDSKRVWVIRADADHSAVADIRASLFYEESCSEELPAVDALISVTVESAVQEFDTPSAGDIEPLTTLLRNT